ncbi:MAG: lactate racemase domain-containing protein [Bryobacteraceae bacterium]
MKYLTFSGNNIVNIDLPDGSDVLYPPPAIPGFPQATYPEHVRRAFQNPRGMPPLKEQVNGNSRVLIAFDDNCQPFPQTPRPDFRQIAIETLLPMLYEYGVRKENIHLICAVALHRKMKEHELRYMVGDQVMAEFYPQQLQNFDAEAPEELAAIGETENGEAVEISRYAVEADLVIYIDAVQIPLNGGHKSVAVGLAGYKSISYHHHPAMTKDSPHVMQPKGSEMHCSIERISRVAQKHCKIMVLEFAMNGATYPAHSAYLGKPDSRCNVLERFLKTATPASMKLLPESARRTILHSVPGDYTPLSVEAGAIDDVHPITLSKLREQLTVDVDRQYDTLVFGLPDLSPYAIDARVNPVLVVSDVLGYVFNWFYTKPLVKRGGAVIIVNPVDEVFHPQYHVAYRLFYDEVLAATQDPFEMQRVYQERYAFDPHLRDCYRNRYAHHGFHPFTVWYWATYPLKYLSQVIMVGPKDDRPARRLGCLWAPSMAAALEMARGGKGHHDVVALTIPPFMYVNVRS